MGLPGPTSENLSTSLSLVIKTSGVFVLKFRIEVINGGHTGTRSIYWRDLDNRVDIFPLLSY